MFKFNCGDEVKDIITGFKGIIQGRAEYLTGCNRYMIESQKLDADGHTQDWYHYDENRLKLIKANKIKLVDDQLQISAKDRGGPLKKDQIPYK